MYRLFKRFLQFNKFIWVFFFTDNGEKLDVSTIKERIGLKGRNKKKNKYMMKKKGKIDSRDTF